MSNRLRRIAGISVLMGATIFSQAGAASASEVSGSTVDAATYKQIDVSKIEISCPTDDTLKVVDYSYTINGVSGFKTLEGNLKHGDTVKVDFTVADGCKDVQLSLASYDAPDGVFSKDTAVKQVLFDSKTGKVGAGKGSLKIVLPDCFYQVDFVRGEVLTKLGPATSDNFYEGRLIDAGNGGEKCVTTKETPPTTVAPAVAPASLERPPVVESAVLAHTGTDVGPDAAAGSALLILGLALQRRARQLVNNRKARIARNKALLEQAFDVSI